MDSGDDLGEDIHDHKVDTNCGLNGGEAVKEEDAHNGLSEGYSGLEGGDGDYVAYAILDDGGGIVEEEGGTRNNLVEKDGGLNCGDATREDLDNQMLNQRKVDGDSGCLA